MKKVGKKGFVFELSLVVITLILLVTVVVQVNSRLQVFKKVVGEEAFDLVKADVDMQSFEFKYDELGKYAFYNSVHDFATNGGKNEVDCGEIDGYNKWTQINGEVFKDCMPTNFMSDFNESFISRFNGILSSVMPEIDGEHEFSIKYDLKSRKLIINENTENRVRLMYKDGATITHKLSLDFDENYDLTIYGKLIALSKSLLAQCGANPIEELSECLGDPITIFSEANGLFVLYRLDGRTVKFDLEQENKFPNFITNNVELRKPLIKFALDISHVSKLK